MEVAQRHRVVHRRVVLIDDGALEAAPNLETSPLDRPHFSARRPGGLGPAQVLARILHER